MIPLEIQNVLSTICLHMKLWIGKHTWLVISIVFSKTKDLSRSQTVIYIINVVVYRKWYQIESLLLQTTFRKWYITYWIEAIPMTCSHLQCHSFQMCFVVCTTMQQLTRFQLTSRVARSIYNSWAFCMISQKPHVSKCNVECATWTMESW